MRECPEGVVQEESFKDIYAKFFPHGNSALYAHYVFKAFDVNCSGAISFRELLVTLSTLLRGSVYERLRWAFRLYDVDGDGAITRQELAEVVVAVHELLGRRAPPGSPAARLDDAKANEQVDRVFRKLDLNQDGVITIEEFLESCLKDDVITRSLQMTVAKRRSVRTAHRRCQCAREAGLLRAAAAWLRGRRYAHYLAALDDFYSRVVRPRLRSVLLLHF
ncbi:hypothetical protein HW555_009465 [Spodoptera exigua]|uniref:EF-hand domain-containing protein n=1 Tax=Spodoptera exigua TaxID=7107 RepID=A0A835L0R6_SPOEX|nr:hypothetical protein HW555_009465 [Spodoptera exigua]